MDTDGGAIAELLNRHGRAQRRYPAEELYDLLRDDRERCNRAHDPAYLGGKTKPQRYAR
ncbi:MAG: hypothetical protein PF961_20250 [Planctomycetota bacterium]|jgi:hypothetical protein|nr:hypothetical protein [Planctomycetota bacterium]